ncbi:MAG: potassium-transporting ATPase subunit KdpC [Hyphomicrobiales bacterium]|nr:MAG: potassium-transporting ATPase subunit KdpC [Hyphomicrobiales bacterium]
MLTLLRPALVLLAFFTALTGLIYPLAITGVSQVLFPQAANGSLVSRDGKVVGSRLIGQSFTSERYFWSRPSATGAADPNDPSKTVDAPYNAMGSAGSNLGPLSKKLVDRVAMDVQRIGNGQSSVPGDAVTTSASGLDPHVSPAFAMLQVDRVAKARGLQPRRVRLLVEQAIETRWLGLIGEPRVNVLLLNLALDRMGADGAG